MTDVPRWCEDLPWLGITYRHGERCDTPDRDDRPIDEMVRGALEHVRRCVSALPPVDPDAERNLDLYLAAREALEPRRALTRRRD